MENKEKIEKYFDLRNESYYVREGYFVESYIDSFLFDNNVNEIINDAVSIFGFFDSYVYDVTEEGEKGKLIDTLFFKLPTKILAIPSEIEKGKKEFTGYTVLNFNSGDTFIAKNAAVRDSGIAFIYFKLMTDGKLPRSIKYDEISYYFEECCKVNDIGIGACSTLSDLFVVVTCRDPKNVNRQFREAIRENPKIDLTKYVPIEINKVPGLSSQFNALTAGNPRAGITATIGATKSGEMKNEEGSMVEKVIL
jgi:hypothetical protein